MSFNPQNDRQAEDRCHRLGQEKVVKIYKLLVEDTVDTYIYDIANEKKQLTDVMLEEGNYMNNEKEAEREIITKFFSNYLSSKLGLENK